MSISNLSGNFQCKIVNGEPELYTNEGVYMKVNGVTFSNKKEDEKITDGTLMITTHRIVYVKDN